VRREKGEMKEDWGVKRGRSRRTEKRVGEGVRSEEWKRRRRRTG
jgi:hypothetical protein